jgi:hypothetical protein
VPEHASPTRPNSPVPVYQGAPGSGPAAGVEEYFIFHLLGDYLAGPYRLSGYRRDASGAYELIEPDAQGRAFSSTLGLWILPEAEGLLRFQDPESGEILLTDEEEKRARLLSEQQLARERTARRAAEQHAEGAEQKAEKEASAREQLSAELALLQERLRKSDRDLS